MKMAVEARPLQANLWSTTPSKAYHGFPGPEQESRAPRLASPTPKTAQAGNDLPSAPAGKDDVSAHVEASGHQRPGGPAGHGGGAARSIRRRRRSRRGVSRQRAADRLRADHQPALRRRLHDRAAPASEKAPRARDRRRLGLPGGGAVAARRAGVE